MNAERRGGTAMNLKAATAVGIFALGLAAGGAAAALWPGPGAGAAERRLSFVLEELEAEFGRARVARAVAEAETRLDEAGLY
jgi:hypothetical protein